MSMFLASGGNPYSHLAEHLRNVPAQAFEGVWTTIDVQPDPFAPQKFTVGVVVGAVDGSYQFRLLDDFSRFECFYGKEDLSALRTLVDYAEHALLRGRNIGVQLSGIHFDVDALSLGPLWPTSGASIEAVAHRLYFDVVPFVPSEQRKGREFLTLDNAAVRKLVDDELKRIAGMEFEVVHTGQQHAIADAQTGQVHWLDFNLAPPSTAGSVISAVYKTPERIELNFLRASRDLSTFSRLRKLGGPLGIFVMTPPPDSMPGDDLARIDHILAEQSWNLEQQGFMVSAHAAASAVAEDVWRWAKPLLAGR